MDAMEMIEKLWCLPIGTRVSGCYKAGNKPTERAQLEALKSEELKVDRKFFYGTYEGMFLNKKAMPVMLIKSWCRYNLDNQYATDSYRAFNPEIGELELLEIGE